MSSAWATDDAMQNTDFFDICFLLFPGLGLLGPMVSTGEAPAIVQAVLHPDNGRHSIVVASLMPNDEAGDLCLPVGVLRGPCDKQASAADAICKRTCIGL